MPNNAEQNQEVERLCRAIPEEKDPAKMLALVQRLNQLLEAGAHPPSPERLRDLRAADGSSPAQQQLPADSIREAKRHKSA